MYNVYAASIEIQYLKKKINKHKTKKIIYIQHFIASYKRTLLISEYSYNQVFEITWNNIKQVKR